MAVDALFWHPCASEQIQGKQGHFCPSKWCVVNFYTETVSTPNPKDWFLFENFWYFVSAVNAVQNHYQIDNFQISSSAEIRTWLLALVCKIINIKCHIMYFVLVIIALVPWVWNDREQSLSLWRVHDQESVGCTCSSAIAAVLYCGDCDEMRLPINPSHAGCAVYCSVFLVLLWLLMQWGSAEASPSGGGVEGKLWVCRWRCFLQLQNPFKFVHFNKRKTKQALMVLF